MQFLYFIPDADAVTEAMLAELGLAEIIGSHQCGRLPGPGPGGSAGMLVASTEGTPADLRYVEAEQVWFPPAADDPDCPREYWLGYWKDSPPTPEDLARADQVAGVGVRMADGREWLAPIARRYVGAGEHEVPLPRRYRLDRETGQVAIRVLEQYRRLWVLSDRLAEVFLDPFLGLGEDAGPPGDGQAADGGRLEMTNGEAWDAVGVILGANYRVGYWEALALELMDDRCIKELFLVVIDFQSLVALAEGLAKKNGADDSSDGNSGGGDSTPPTGPPGRTSTPS